MPNFLHLSMDDTHFGYKKKSLKKKNTLVWTLDSGLWTLLCSLLFSSALSVPCTFFCWLMMQLLMYSSTSSCVVVVGVVGVPVVDA